MTCVDVPLLLFAKAPIAGRVKTRLRTHCSAQQAADIAKILMEASVKKAISHWPGAVYLSVWLDQEHDFFKHILASYPIQMSVQREGDLGDKMRDALAAHGYPAAVMGCDAPHVKAESLGLAYQRLQAGKSVIGPAQDGGYYFLGLTESADSIFKDMPWGTDQVLEKTLKTALLNGLKIELIESLNDVDEWQDVLEVAGQLPELQVYLEENRLLG